MNRKEKKALLADLEGMINGSSLGTEEDFQRWSSVLTPLSQVGEPWAFKALFRAMGAGTGYFLEAVQEALVRSDPDALASYIRNCLRWQWSSGQVANYLDILGESGGPQAEEIVIGQLMWCQGRKGLGAHGIANEAIVALEKMGTPQALNYLATVLFGNSLPRRKDRLDLRKKVLKILVELQYPMSSEHLMRFLNSLKQDQGDALLRRDIMTVLERPGDPYALGEPVISTKQDADTQFKKMPERTFTPMIGTEEERIDLELDELASSSLERGPCSRWSLEELKAVILKDAGLNPDSEEAKRLEALRAFLKNGYANITDIDDREQIAGLETIFREVQELGFLQELEPKDFVEAWDDDIDLDDEGHMASVTRSIIFCYDEAAFGSDHRFDSRDIIWNAEGCLRKWGIELEPGTPDGKDIILDRETGKRKGSFLLNGELHEMVFQTPMGVARAIDRAIRSLGFVILTPTFHDDDYHFLIVSKEKDRKLGGSDYFCDVCEIPDEDF